MRPGDQAGVVAFDTHVSVVQAITTDHQALTKAIDLLQSGSDTAMFDALMSAEQLLANVNGRKAIVLLTDGMDNRSKNNEDAVIKAIGPSGLTISTIGLGNPQDVKSLQGIDETEIKVPRAASRRNVYLRAESIPACIYISTIWNRFTERICFDLYFAVHFARWCKS